MDHQQPTHTTPKKLEPTQKTNTANNKRKMRRPRNPRMGHRALGGRPPGHPLRRPPLAPRQLHNARHRHRPHPTRRSKQPQQPPTPVPPLPRLQDHSGGPCHTHTQDTHANTADTTTSLRLSTKKTKQNEKRKRNKISETRTEMREREIRNETKIRCEKRPAPPGGDSPAPHTKRPGEIATPLPDARRHTFSCDRRHATAPLP